MVVAPAAEAGRTRSKGASSKFSCELDEQLDLARTDMIRIIEKQEETMNSFTTSSEISASATRMRVRIRPAQAW
jgi:hypothetical protein